MVTLLPDPLDADIVYGAGRSEVSRFHWSTGQVDNVTPIPNGIAVTHRGDKMEAADKEKEQGKKYRTDRTEPIVFSPG